MLMRSKYVKQNVIIGTIYIDESYNEFFMAVIPYVNVSRKRTSKALCDIYGACSFKITISSSYKF